MHNCIGKVCARGYDVRIINDDNGHKYIGTIDKENNVMCRLSSLSVKSDNDLDKLVPDRYTSIEKLECSNFKHCF